MRRPAAPKSTGEIASPNVGMSNLKYCKRIGTALNLVSTSAALGRVCGCALFLARLLGWRRKRKNATTIAAARSKHLTGLRRNHRERHFANVRYWRKADNPKARAFVRYWATSDNGKFWLAMVCPLMTQSGHQTTGNCTELGRTGLYQSGALRG
jgi:hypothetical protein